jgi:hypothetical protein
MDDLKLIIEANGVTDEQAVLTLLDWCKGSARRRDLRVLRRLIRDAHRFAGEESPSREDVLKALGAE